MESGVERRAPLDLVPRSLRNLGLGMMENRSLHRLWIAGVSALDLAIEVVRRLCRFGAWMAGMLFIASAVLIGVEVVLRKVFNSSTGGADELSGYGLAIASAWAFGFALLERVHIRVDSFYLLLPRWLRAVLDVLGIALFLMFFGLMFSYALRVLEDTIEMGTRSRTGLYIPLAIPESIWVVGLGLTVLVPALLLLRAILDLAAGNALGVQRLIGSKSVMEEVEDELAQAKARSSLEGERAH